MATIKWEKVTDATPHGGMGWFDTSTRIVRAKVPGGWIVRELAPNNATAFAFVPDPQHKWT